MDKSKFLDRLGLGTLQNRFVRPNVPAELSPVEEFVTDCLSAQENRPISSPFHSLNLRIDETAKVLKALTPHQRKVLFRDCLARLAAHGIEPDQGAYFEYRDPNYHYLSSLLTVRRLLVEIGFEIDAETVVTVLRICLAGNPGASTSRALTHCTLTAYTKLGSIRSIQLAKRAGLELDDEAHQLLNSIRETLSEARACTKDIREQCRRYVGQIEDILHIEHVPLIERLLPLPQRETLEALTLREQPSDKERAYDDALDVLAVLRKDVLLAYGPEGSYPAWMTDREVFEERFGKSPIFPERGGFKFWESEGWDPELRHFGAFYERKREEELITPQLTAAWRSRRGELADCLPYRWSGESLPGVECFLFEGRDPKGSLLEHVATARHAKPSKKWLKVAVRISSDLGPDLVRDTLIAWLDLLAPPSDIESIIDKYEILARYDRVANRWNKFDDDGDAPVGEPPLSREVRINRLALRMLQGTTAQLSVVAKGRFLDFTDAHQFRRSPHRPLSDRNSNIVRGVIWTLSHWPADEVVRCLERTAQTLLSKSFGEFRCLVGANACVWSLGDIGTRDAVFALGRIRRSIKDKALAKQVSKAMVAVGEKVGLTRQDMEEIAVPDYGLDKATNRRVEAVEDYDLVLEVSQSSKARAFAIGPRSGKAKSHRSIPKAALSTAENRELADDLKRGAKDIVKVLPEVRRRIEACYRTSHAWDYPDWLDRYLNHGLAGWLTRRLIWTFACSDGTAFAALPTENGFVDATGAVVQSPCSEFRVTPWHPLTASTEEIVGWRRLLLDREIRQPFMQAWRPLYVVTDAERATGTYSNRFAGHILMQAPLVAMTRRWNWTARARVPNDPESEQPMRLALPHFGVAAELWGSGTGPISTSEYACAFAHFSTDRLQFYSLDPATGDMSSQPMPIAEVPPLVLCEVMRDIDVMVGVTSLGADRYWTDRGPDAGLPRSEMPALERYRATYDKGAQGELARTRRAFLEMLLPKLDIADKCHLTKRHLVVEGVKRTYKIHLGSGNVLVAPDDSYLCIVPSGRHMTECLLPFEGDDTISLILSKAFLLAADDKITDKTIVSQIDRVRHQR